MSPWRLLFRLVAALPLPFAQALGAAIGTLAWLAPTKLRRLTRFHVERCLPALPAAQRRRVARRSLQHFGRAVLESPALWLGGRHRVRRWLRTVEGWEAVDRAMEEGRGVILFTPHLGCWEAMGLDASLRWPITHLYKAQKGELDDLALEGRSRFGAGLAGSDAAGVRKLLAALRRGEAVGFLPDQDPPAGAGAMAPFFGHPAHTPVLPVKLLRKTGATAFFCWAERRTGWRGWGRPGFDLRYVPAPPEIGSADTGTALAALNRGVEELVRQRPEQYWWGYPRFRRQTAGTEKGTGTGTEPFYPPGTL